MSMDGPQQPQRPWVVRVRTMSWRTGEWGRWRTFSTHASWDSATRRAGELLSNEYEAKVFHRDTLSDLHRLGGAA